MRNYRLGYSIAAAVTWVVWIAIPIRVLLFVLIPANDRGDGMRIFNWVMLVFLGLLATLFTFRAMRGNSPK